MASDAELYEFRFQAVWGLNFKSEYTVHLRVTPVTQSAAESDGKRHRNRLGTRVVRYGRGIPLAVARSNV